MTVKLMFKTIVTSPVETKGYFHSSLKEDMKHTFSATQHEE